MAYRYQRRRSTRAPARRRYARGSYARRYRTARRRVSRAPQQRIVIQVVGGPSGVAASPISLGMKSARIVRRRF